MKQGRISCDKWGDHQSSGKSLTADERRFTRIRARQFICVHPRSSAVTVWLCFNSHTEQIQGFFGLPELIWMGVNPAMEIEGKIPEIWALTQSANSFSEFKML
jgi:hypothetical protein